MKKNLSLVTLICGFLYIILSAHSAGPAYVANLDCTGVISSGCGGSTCHGTTPSPQITDTVFVMNDSGHYVNYYVPGDVYTLRIRGFNNSMSTLPKFGFQLTVVKKGTDSSVGTLIGTPTVHITYVTPRLAVSEHTHPLWCSGSGGFGTMYQADVQWMAPSADTIAVRAVLCAVDTNGAANPADLWSAPGAPVLVHEGHPPTIFGPQKVCIGFSTGISHTPTGGTWTSSDPSIATVVSPGTVTGITPGTINLSYTTPNGTTSVIFTVNPLPATISGIPVVCTGGTTTLTDSTPGGTWSSSNPGVATVGAANGVVTLVGSATGAATISYKVTSTGCYKTMPLVISSGASVTGPPLLCRDDSAMFTYPYTGGTWHSSSSAATVSSWGMVTGVSSGTSIISYSLGTTGCNAQKTVSVNVCSTEIANPFTQANDLRIFPNPNRGSFALNVLSTFDEEAYIVVTNVVGAKVREFTIKTNELNSITLNQPAGTYFLSATTLSGKHFIKIVVE